MLTLTVVHKFAAFRCRIFWVPSRFFNENLRRNILKNFIFNFLELLILRSGIIFQKPTRSASNGAKTTSFLNHL